jgi:hypothetical protein|tara:strand:+ start:288 stop:515 length:228 start_codon:yes stop_codon:yes gene_type:complete
MLNVMKFRGQVVFDIQKDKFKYLHREGVNTKNRVDIVDLNKRLNEAKKISFYNNAKIIFASCLLLGVVALLSTKF